MIRSCVLSFKKVIDFERESKEQKSKEQKCKFPTLDSPDNVSGMLLKSYQHLLEVDLVLLHSVTGDEGVVQVDKAVVQPLQHLVHEELKILSSILKPESHS